MAVAVKIDCPACGRPLVRKPGGRCPACGAEVAEHVVAARNREERIEKVVAVVSTILVLGVLLIGSGAGILEGIAAYAIGGAIVWFLAKRLFF